MAGGMSPIPPCALKVVDGHVAAVQAQATDYSDHHASGSHQQAIGNPPDGTYLRLSYVIEVLEGMSEQRWEGQEIPPEAGHLLSRTPFRDTVEYFRMREM